MKVLILDDQPGLAETFALSLRSIGYSATGFNLASDALAALQADDILLTDYHMPDMTGLEVKACIRSRLEGASLLDVWQCEVHRRTVKSSLTPVDFEQAVPDSNTD